jgi:hypothetical protein
VKFELEWSLQGRATIEADDRDEAENLLADGLLDLDSSMFETVDIDTVTVDAVEELAE